MAKKKKGEAGGSCCQVTSLVSVDERGQMVLPKEIRERAGIKAGDKLALVAWEKDGAICCLTLIKAGELAGMVKEKLGPLLAGLVRE
ncbi:MAG: AbrB/MazE/SpoVT family DNA-binding domain-containing protein [Candidatus Aminicenantes bacterium]|nr:AbrB/MazE/SpoVT family DNA-binding domain-containing protein [Candidatus Aminicenantes bacterium]